VKVSVGIAVTDMNHVKTCRVGSSPAIRHTASMTVAVAVWATEAI
jgi:hypothetical protein